MAEDRVAKLGESNFRFCCLLDCLPVCVQIAGTAVAGNSERSTEAYNLQVYYTLYGV